MLRVYHDSIEILFLFNKTSILKKLHNIDTKIWIVKYVTISLDC
jgi:hypothetical protein